MLEDWTNRESNGVGLLLNALAGATALRYPNLGGYFAAAVLALVGIVLILDGWHRRYKARLPVAPTTPPAPPEIRYTSDGLNTGIPRTSPTSGSGNVTTILQVLPSGTELPQPLTLRVECSRDLDDGWATFNTDTKVLNTTKRLPPIRADIKEGKIAYFELLAPKLSPPAMLSLNLMWHQEHDDEEDITVLVTRRE
jgi:hypothetical protein